MKSVKAYVILGVSLFCTCVLSGSSDMGSTTKDRAALFDYILNKTMEREAFSPIKNKTLHLDIKRGMLRFREELIAADTDEKLFYALIKISNARKDRHLRVNLVDGGLRVEPFQTMQAPIRFAVDYGTPGEYSLFVADYTENVSDFAENSPEIGDKLVKINGQTVGDYLTRIEPYIRYSTINGLWWKFAEELSLKHFHIPASFYRENVAYELKDKTGRPYSLVLPFLKEDAIKWQGFWKSHGDARYPGFDLEFSTKTYDLYRPQDGKKVLLLDWYGFRENLMADMDRLMDYASKHDLLDYAIIWDGSRSRGGSKGVYALQRLSPSSFKTTFGNLRLSDITEAFIREKRDQFNRRQVNDAGVRETADDGNWLMHWLETDVLQGLRAGQAYSNNVPFKLAHLPKYSDGVAEPAAVHFRGPIVCFLSPQGGSHLDQLAAMVVDNDLGHAIGMPAGGYSNTWEWQETLVFPISKKPVAEFMWSIGHTIRPNGEILEGNPAQVDEFVPLTSDNYLDYYEVLLSKALEHLGLE